jgi:hypothetical protein
VEENLKKAPANTVYAALNVHPALFIALVTASFQKTILKTAVLFCSILLLAPQPSLAAKAKSQAQEKIKKSSWGLTAQLEATTSLHHFSDPDKTFGTNYWMIPTVDVSSKLKLSAVLVLQQFWLPKNDAKFANSVVSLRHSGAKLSKVFSLSPAIGMTIPMNEDSIDRQSLVLGLRIGPRLSFDLSSQGLPVSGFADVSIRRNFHEFQTTTAGTSNTMAAVVNRFNAGLGITKKLSVSADFIYNTGWTFLSNFKDSFELGEEISFSVNKNLSLSAGHSNSGGLLEANGQDSNLDIFDEQSSSVYGAVAYKF